MNTIFVSCSGFHILLNQGQYTHQHEGQHHLQHTQLHKDSTICHSTNTTSTCYRETSFDEAECHMGLPAASRSSPPRRPVPNYAVVLDVEADQECMVCLCGPDEEVSMFPCRRHEYHTSCLIRLWQEDYRCPICRHVSTINFQYFHISKFPLQMLKQHAICGNFPTTPQIMLKCLISMF